MSVFSDGPHPEERLPDNKAAQATAETIDEAIRRGVAPNTATAANLPEALGLLARACGIPVGQPGWQQYRSTATRQGEKVVIEVEPVAED